MTPFKLMMIHFQKWTWAFEYKIIEGDEYQYGFKYLEYINSHPKILVIMNHQSLLDASIGPLTQCTYRISTAIAKDDVVNWCPLLLL